MESSPNLPLEIKSNADVVTQEIIEASYCTAIKHLKTSICSYVFLNEKFKKGQLGVIGVKWLNGVQS